MCASYRNQIPERFDQLGAYKTVLTGNSLRVYS
jgi:hypothetical protein